MARRLAIGTFALSLSPRDTTDVTDRRGQRTRVVGGATLARALIDASIRTTILVGMPGTTTVSVTPRLSPQRLGLLVSMDF